MRGARPKHVEHGCNAGRVETQRLVECLRALPSRKKGMRGEVRGTGGGRAVRWRRREQRARGRVPTGDRGAGHAAERTANMALMSVTLDVSRLSGWLNAFASCAESKGSHAKEGSMCG